MCYEIDQDTLCFVVGFGCWLLFCGYLCVLLFLCVCVYALALVLCFVLFLCVVAREIY